MAEQMIAIPESRLRNIETMLQQLVRQNKEWINIEEASALSKLTTRTLYNYLDKGKLKGVQHQYRGRTLEFNQADFVKWNEQRVFRVRD